jgi:hypothetical protein
MAGWIALPGRAGVTSLSPKCPSFRGKSNRSFTESLRPGVAGCGRGAASSGSARVAGSCRSTTQRRVNGRVHLDVRNVRSASRAHETRSHIMSSTRWHRRAPAHREAGVWPTAPVPGGGSKSQPSISIPLNSWRGGGSPIGSIAVARGGSGASSEATRAASRGCSGRCEVVTGCKDLGALPKCRRCGTCSG